MLNQLLQRVWGQSAPATVRTTRPATPVKTMSGTNASGVSAQPLRTATLVRLVADANKYYEMRENEDATFDAYYGRVGGFRSKATHPIDQWERKIREKKAKGYIDQTHSFSDSNPGILFASKDLTIEPVLDSQVQTLIKRMMGSNADKFDSAFSVRHAVTDSAFEQYVRQQKNRKTRPLWHNSRSGNWLSSLQTNLSLQTASEHNAGKMPDKGIHFTEQFSCLSRSSSSPGNYRQHEGYLAIYEVHLGEQPEQQYRSDSADKPMWRHPQLNSSLSDSEFIVYNPAQCTVRYIVKIKA